MKAHFKFQTVSLNTPLFVHEVKLQNANRQLNFTRIYFRNINWKQHELWGKNLITGKKRVRLRWNGALADPKMEDYDL
jgi:hypothetical protein